MGVSKKVRAINTVFRKHAPKCSYQSSASFLDVSTIVADYTMPFKVGQILQDTGLAEFGQTRRYSDYIELRVVVKVSPKTVVLARYSPGRQECIKERFKVKFDAQGAYVTLQVGRYQGKPYNYVIRVWDVRPTYANVRDHCDENRYPCGWSQQLFNFLVENAKLE